MRQDIENAPSDQAVFGPVPSRRLGMSLGVDLLTPPKTCTLDCVYCELGPTPRTTVRRGVWRDPEQVLDQVRARLAELDYPPDFLTLAGSGEPTLHSGLGRVIAGLKDLNAGAVAVLTNGTLLPDPAVAADLMAADVVVPSLDAVSRRAFRRVNRPAPGLDPAAMVEAMAAFRRAFTGRLWLEVLLVAGVNDDPDEIAGIMAAAQRIAPEKVQLGTIVRPPAAPGHMAVAHERLVEIAAAFPVPAEVISPPAGRGAGDRGRLARAVAEMTRRRPCTLEDIANMTGLGPAARGLVETMLAEGRLAVERFGDVEFYRGR